MVTVVVTDLTDSTRLLEKLGTEGWVDLMNSILHILESEISRFGGEVSQFRGDGLVAFFGASLAHEDDPERAVLAGLSMQRAMKTYVRELNYPEATELKMRVGINTGDVIVTGLSGRQHWEEAAMGQAITIAARMETAAESGTVLVSQHTHSLVEAQFEWHPLGELNIKGASQPIAVFRPLTHIIDAKQLPQNQIFANSLPRVGRNAEFHKLKEGIIDLFNGRGRIAAVIGDKGSGKSFLTKEVKRYFLHRGALLAETHTIALPEKPRLTWVSGRCRSYSHSWPYTMWIDLICDWLAFRPDATKDEKRDILRQRATELWDGKLDEHYPYLATLMGLPLEESFSDKIRHLDAEGLQRRFFLAIRNWIETSLQRGPVVISFSDLQWADDSSLALLQYCLPICDNGPIFWILTFRLEREQPIGGFYHHLLASYPHRLTSVSLKPLTKKQGKGFIARLIGAKTLPPETTEMIIHNAGGNPYYIIELIRVLISKGILACNDDCSEWHTARPITTLDLPESLQQLLTAQMDRLPNRERLILQAAAVIGQVFWFNPLQALLGDPPTLRADLAALQRAEIIEESGRIPELGMQYVIKSPLLRDAAYESLLNAQHIAYHLRIAQYLETLPAPDVPGGYDGMLARHYRGAGDPKKELFYTLLAADHARKIYANAEAVQHYTRALELLNILESASQSPEETRLLLTERFEVLMDRREINLHLGQIDAARQDTQALFPLAHQMEDDPVWRIDALLAHADFPANLREELEPGLRMAEEALTLAQKLGDKQRELFSLTSVAQLRLNLRDHGVLGLAEEALNLARQLGDLKTEVKLLLGIGNAYGMDDLPRSREYLEAALASSEKLNDKKIELSLLEALGRQFERAGDYYRQLTDYEMKKLRISREIGNRYIEGLTLMFCGQIQGLYLGDYETGLDLERQALQIWENMNITGRIFPLLRIAQIQAAQGRYPEALLTIETANPLADKVVMDIGRAGLGLVKAIVYNALGDEDHLREALNLTSQIQQMVANNLVSRQYQMTAACEAAAAHLELAQHLGERKNAEAQEHLWRALECSQTALNIYEQFGFVQVVECSAEEVLFRHSQALAANGQMAKSNEFLKRAYDEMMRKLALIPAESPFRKTYLENIQLHQQIYTACTGRTLP